VLEDKKRPAGERLRAASALAAYAGNDARWQGVRPDVAARLVAEPGLVIARWAEALRPVRPTLLPPLAEILVREGHDAAGRRTFTGLYGDCAKGLPNAFAALENEASGASVTSNDSDDRLAQQRRQANAAVALASLGTWQRAISLLRHAPDPTVRSYLIDRLGPGGAEAEALVALLRADVGAPVRRAALLALGEFGDDRLPPPERDKLTTQLAEIYRDDPDPGLHSVAGWLLLWWGSSGARRRRAAPRQQGGRWILGAGTRTHRARRWS
jgi:hypothetical protein